MLPAVDASGWIARAERTVYDNRWVRLGLVDVEARRTGSDGSTMWCTWTEWRWH